MERILRTAIVGATYYELRRVSAVTWYLCTVLDGHEYLAIFHDADEAHDAFNTLTKG